MTTMPSMEMGIHTISNEVYHSSMGVSRSALWKLRKSPYHYWYEYLNPLFQKPNPTPSMIMGELVHCLALEPDEFCNRYAVAPELNKRTKEGKEKWIEFESANAHKTIVTNDVYLNAEIMSKNLKENDMFASLVDGADIEKSIYFIHQKTAITCKVRPDIWTGSLVTDLKTTADASYRGFQSSAYKYGYFLQAGMIHEALNSLGQRLEKFAFACVENKEPFATALYVLDEEAIDYGVQLFDKLMAKLNDCLLSGEWPCYEMQTLCVPNYANYED